MSEQRQPSDAGRQAVEPSLRADEPPVEHEPAAPVEHEPAAPDDHSPLEPAPATPSARVEPVVVPRWIQLVVLPLALLGAWALARAVGPVLLVFAVASVIALILNPLVKLLQRRARLPRGVAVAAVYIGFFMAVAGIGVLLANPVSSQVESFQRDVPNLVRSANNRLADVQRWLDRHHVNVQVKTQGQTALQTLQKKVVKSSGSLVSFTKDLLQKVVEAAFALILVLVISIYMLIYGDRIGRVARSVMPPGDGSPEDDYPLRTQKAVYHYVRGQLLFSLTMGLTAGIALWIFGAVGIFPDGKRYALFFGAFFGLMELIPYVGPVLGSLPPLLVALFSNPLMALWVLLLFLAIQQIEGHIVAPQIFGHSLRINPLLVILALLVGGELYGILGALVALPLAAVVRETVVYLRAHVVLEPWGTPTAAAVAAGGLPARPLLSPQRRCEQCGAAVAEGDAFCRSCGSPLHSPAETAG
jgi:predicted PurR-regulated permease PerM